MGRLPLSPEKDFELIKAKHTIPNASREQLIDFVLMLAETCLYQQALIQEKWGAEFLPPDPLQEIRKNEGGQLGLD